MCGEYCECGCEYCVVDVEVECVDLFVVVDLLYCVDCCE